MRGIAAALTLWVCAVVPAFAQNVGNLPIVGVLRINTADTVEPTATGFKDALAALGQVDGRNIRIEVRLAEGHVERIRNKLGVRSRTEVATWAVAHGLGPTKLDNPPARSTV